MGISKTIPWRKDGILEGSIQNTGSTGDVSFIVFGSSSEKITVNYGDGTSETKSLNNGSFTHTYPANSGPFRITVTGALFGIKSIDGLPGFKLQGLIHTPILTTLNINNILKGDGPLTGNDSAVGDIKFFQFAPNLIELSLLNAFDAKGSIDVFQNMNGQLGQNGLNFAISNSHVNGDTNNFTAISSTVTEIRFENNKLTGTPKDILTSSTLSNVERINLANNELSGDTGDINTNITQSNIIFINIGGNANLDLDTSLFEKAAFSNVTEIIARGLNSYTGDDAFLTNTTSLERLFINQVPITADKFANCASTLTDVICDNLQGNASVFGNNSFPNLFRIITGGSNVTISGDVANFDLPELFQIVIRKTGLTGTIKFTQNQELVKVNFDDNNITDIDNANNNYKLDRLQEFKIQDNDIPQTPLSDWWVFNDDSTLNVPGSNETYVMDSSGNNMGTLTAAAQTAANNIASKGWTTSFNS